PPTTGSRTMPWMQEVSRSHIARATAGTCTLTYGRRPTKSAHSNPKFRLNRRGPVVAGRLPQLRWRRLRRYQPRALAGLAVFKGLFGLIDELSAEFATDPPGQPTLAGAAFR